MSEYNPVEAANSVSAAYREYLASSFTPFRSEVAAAFENAIAGQSISSLVLEPKRSYQKGARIADLVTEGVLAGRFSDLVREGTLPAILHDHQERALRAAVDHMENVVVATGTGSGKTEAFLLPILNGLLREHEAGLLATNVKAILLYPMNALANDQMKRIREIFRLLPEEITFGRYIGATEYRQADAEKDWRERNRLGSQRPRNELISREVMDATPPHVLLTNYAMLERLLLLPRSKSLFSRDLQWLALDEVHSYDGARGAEMAFLLRRLRQRTVGTRGRLQCFAASATLGSGWSSAPEIAHYATELFDEPFEPSGVITPTHVPLEVPPNVSVLQESALKKLEANVPINLDDPAWAELKKELRANPTSLPVRYHQIVKSPAGAFVCLDSRHVDGKETPRISLHPGRSCGDCAKRGIQSRLFELAACRSCGVEYLRGRERSGQFEQANPQDELPGYALLGVTRTPLDPPDISRWSPGADSSEKDDSFGEPEADRSPKTICTSCLTISDSDPACACGGTSFVSVFVAKGVAGTHIERCLNCGYVGAGFGPVARAVPGGDSLSAVLASSLYASVPTDPSNSTPGGARKLLAFSDNRQDAAYFAPFLKLENDKLLRRGIIFTALRNLETDRSLKQPWESDVLASAIARELSERGMSLNNIATQTARTWLRAELMPRDTRQSLEGVGLLRCSLASDSLASAAAVLEIFGIEQPETVARMLIDTMRPDGAIGLQKLVSADDPVFAPIEVEHFYVLEGKTKANQPYHRWLGATRDTKNRRTRLVRKALDRAGVGDTVHEADVLREVWERLAEDGVLAGRAIGLNIPLESWLYDSPREGRYFCSNCRRWTWLGGTICPTPSCMGTPTPEIQPENYWSAIYRSPHRVQPMEVKEHTAQWASDEAQKVQEEFIEGTVNVLSGSTTFEMGVDVGAIQAVFCRNVPPTPANYIQRAGRAGRRAGDTSLSVTLARTRSHDTYYAANPELLVAGVVPVPSIDINNVDLARRHLYATALSTFLTETSVEVAGRFSCGFFFEPPLDRPDEPSLVERFAAWLKGPGLASVPAEDIGFSEEINTALGIPMSGSWVDTLTSAGTDTSTPGPLTIARTLYAEDVKVVRERREEVGAQSTDPSLSADRRAKLNKRESVLLYTEATLQKRDAIGELANNGVLPKYGFPVDVVVLHPVLGDESNAVDVEKLNLSRDLRQALREYAPGNEVMAAGSIIRSLGLKTLAGYSFLLYDYVACERCDWFTHRLRPEVEGESNLPDACGSCEGPVTSRTFVAPTYGFVGRVQRERGGSRRPISRVRTRTYLSYAEEFLRTDKNDMTVLTPTISYRGGGTAKRLTLTTSPLRICLNCGYTETEKRSKTPKDGHPDYRRADPETARCAKQLSTLHLGHEHRTELLEILLDLDAPICVCGDPECDGAWRSVAAALAVGAARLLKVSGGDIDADVTGGREPRLMIFDTTTGGAGYTRAISTQIPSLLRSALAVSQSCVCTSDGSCYQCLRNYQNQAYHDHLSRGAAERLLSQALASI